MDANTLICPFLTDDPMFSRGVEFGMLHARMRDTPELIADYFQRENQEQILLLANRLGWKILDMRPWDEGWIMIVMEPPEA